MTIDEYHAFERRLYGLVEKGFELNTILYKPPSIKV